MLTCRPAALQYYCESVRKMLAVAIEEARIGLAEGGIPIGAAFYAEGDSVSRGPIAACSTDPSVTQKPTPFAAPAATQLPQPGHGHQLAPVGIAAARCASSASARGGRRKPHFRWRHGVAARQRRRGHRPRQPRVPRAARRLYRENIPRSGTKISAKNRRTTMCPSESTSTSREYDHDEALVSGIAGVFFRGKEASIRCLETCFGCNSSGARRKFVFL